MSIEKNPSPPVEAPTGPKHVENSTDATQGQPLAERALQRRAELQAALDALRGSDARPRNDLELALSSVDALLSGDSAHLADATAAELSRWLETNKHLAERAPRARRRKAKSA